MSYKSRYKMAKAMDQDQPVYTYWKNVPENVRTVTKEFGIKRVDLGGGLKHYRIVKNMGLAECLIVGPYYTNHQNALGVILSGEVEEL